MENKEQDLQQDLFRILNIVRNDERYSPERAYIEVIKIIFMKLVFEKENKKILNSNEIKNKKIKINELYLKTNIFYNNKLFDLNEKIYDEILIKEQTVIKIINYLEKYNFSVLFLNSNLMSIIYNKFKNRVFRGYLGEKNTPVCLSSFMIDYIKPNENDKIYDINSKTGELIVSTIKYKLNQKNLFMNSNSDLYTSLSSKVNMIINKIPLSNETNKHVFEIKEDLLEENIYDIVMSDLPNFEMGIKKDSTIMSLKMMIKLLKKGGKAIFIIDDKYLIKDKYKSIRNFIKKETIIKSIISIPGNAYLSLGGCKGNSSILTLEKKENKEEVQLKDNILIANLKKVDSNIINPKKNENDLNTILKYELSNTKKIIKEDKEIIKYVKLEDFEDNFDIKEQFKFKPYQNHKKEDMIQLSSFLEESKIKVEIKEEKEYKRITIKSNNNGITTRDVIKGNIIKTKEQYLVRKEQFIISMLGADTGNFGIVPKELDKSITTNSFKVFTINKNIVIPEYFNILSKSKEFNAFCKLLMNNKIVKRLDIKLFLKTFVPIPNITKQKEVIRKYKQQEKKINTQIRKLREMEKVLMKIV